MPNAIMSSSIVLSSSSGGKNEGRGKKAKLGAGTGSKGVPGEGKRLLLVVSTDTPEAASPSLNSGKAMSLGELDFDGSTRDGSEYFESAEVQVLRTRCLALCFSNPTRQERLSPSKASMGCNLLHFWQNRMSLPLTAISKLLIWKLHNRHRCNMKPTLGVSELVEQCFNVSLKSILYCLLSKIYTEHKCHMHKNMMCPYVPGYMLSSTCVRSLPIGMMPYYDLLWGCSSAVGRRQS